jgi:hypothetical protein
MEVIKKRICLEDFRSRIPGMFNYINKKSNDTNGSWGKFPKIMRYSTYLNDDNEYESIDMRYNDFMEIYYALLDTLCNSRYYEYENDGVNESRWLERSYDWRFIFESETKEYAKSKVRFVSSLPTKLTQEFDEMIYGVTSEYCSNIYNDVCKTLLNNIGDIDDGIHVLQNMNKILGIEFTPSIYTEIFVPKILFLSEVPERISMMEKMKDETNGNPCVNICKNMNYDNYGGDSFLSYLYDLKTNKYDKYSVDDGGVPTINIPILLTSKSNDLGQYRAYDVDLFDEQGNKINDNVSDLTNDSGYCVTSGESKFLTMKKRRISVDDYGNELPGIIEHKIPSDANSVNTKTLSSVPENKVGDDNIKYINVNGVYYEWNNSYVPCYHKMLIFPYSSKYVKNLEYVNNSFYGDGIYSMVYDVYPKSVSQNEYENLQNKLDLYDIKGSFISGTTENPVTNNKNFKKEYYSIDTNYGNNSESFTRENVIEYAENKISDSLYELNSYLKSLIRKEYPKYYGFKQDFNYKFNLIYGGELLENGELKEETVEVSTGGTVYVIIDDEGGVNMEVTYVVGGLCKSNGNSLNETPPFGKETWNGYGVWYREVFPVKKFQTKSFKINGVQMEFMYDEIDFSTKETTHSIDGVDSIIKNYILCDEVAYKTGTYKNDCSNDFIFKDEKMMGLNFPLKESYNLSFDRGSSAAFERHLQLTDIKTFQDLENYRNGMFLNK